MCNAHMRLPRKIQRISYSILLIRYKVRCSHSRIYLLSKNWNEYLKAGEEFSPAVKDAIPEHAGFWKRLCLTALVRLLAASFSAFSYQL